VKGKTFAWTGDGNNVLHSLIEASARFGFNAQHRRAREGSEPRSAMSTGRAQWRRGDLARSAEEAV
jgi:ornithine carbamoyltransferase